MDILNWITRNGGAAFLLALFILTVLGLAGHFFIELVRVITGHYPTVTRVACNCEENDVNEEDDEP
jgi:hypothetical protein